jgi:hypothetical protein
MSEQLAQRRPGRPRKAPLPVAPGSVWRDDLGGKVRVMAVVERYVVWRRPYCMPGVLSVAGFLRRFRPEAE